MNAKTAAVPEMQSELSRVALSLEAFVVNGIPLGVMQSTSFPGFLGKVAGNLTRELDNLETHAVSHGLPDTVATPLTSLRTRCGELVRSVGALTNFQAMPFPQVRSAVQQVRGAWQECVQAIRELETVWGTAEDFNRTRPQAAQTANDLLADLEQIFADEWAAAHETQPLH